MGDHDKLFKRVFAVPEHASGELRSVLPASVVAGLDLGALELVPGSFVDAEMVERHTDLLFRAPIVGSTGCAYVYFLLEHQSEPDRLMPWRVLGYMHRIWEAVLRAEPERTSLPAVITVVVHHGERPWSTPRRMHDVVDGLEELPELGAFVPELDLLIDDLVVADDEALARRPVAALPKVALWLLRDGRDVEAFLAHLAAWAGELERMVREDRGHRDVALVVRYIWRVAGATPFEIVRQRVIEVAPAMEETMASIEEQLIAKGIAKGIEQGFAQGVEQATRATLARLLRARFGSLSADVEEKIAEATIGELDAWVERVVTAGRLEEVFDS